MMRQALVASYGLLVGACYADILQFAVPSESTLMPVRGLNMVLLMGIYGWCCGKDRLLPTRRPLVEILFFPFAMIAALLAGCVCLAWCVPNWLCFLFRKAAVN
jgi:hypothetical protein